MDDDLDTSEDVLDTAEVLEPEDGLPDNTELLDPEVLEPVYVLGLDGLELPRDP